MADPYDCPQPLTRRWGRRPGSGNPDIEPILRDVARHVVDRGISPWSAIKEIVAQESSPSVRRLLEKWKELGPVLLKEISLGKEIASYDPGHHAKAEIGTLAWVNQNSKLWASASRDGWHAVQGLGSGEVLIRRDLWGVLPSNGLPLYNEKLLERLKHIGFA